MKRFHLHMHVEDLDKNIAFYSAMFNQQPARAETDYAKWMLDDPPVNFAISTRGVTAGIDHLGIQVESQQDLAQLRGHAAKAGMTILDEGETSCCYARSDKYWLTDPQGVAWEQFQTLQSIPMYSQPKATDTACCGGKSYAQPLADATLPLQAAKACC